MPTSGGFRAPSQIEQHGNRRRRRASDAPPDLIPGNGRELIKAGTPKPRNTKLILVIQGPPETHKS
eukprot:8329420-Pyramimonas_sp.AAC.1